MNLGFLKDRLMLVIVGLCVSGIIFWLSPFITEYIDVYFILIVVVMLCVNRLEIRRLKDENKKLKSKIPTDQDK